MIRVAINGFGRIGRCALRQIRQRTDMKVVAINDLTDAMDLAYLYKYDSVHRTLGEAIGYDENSIIFQDDKIKVYKETDPSKLPWGLLEVDGVLACTGVFTSGEKAKAHLEAGAKKVIISAPAKDEVKTIVYSVNDKRITSEDKIISAASCTTNCLAPVLKVLDDAFGVESGFMSTVHAVTNDQETLDIPHKKGIASRRGRSALLNIIPTSTGAASAIGNLIPKLDGKLDGTSYRVPVGDGSIIDLSVLVSKEVTVEEVNEAFRSKNSEVLKLVTVPLVSSDIIGTTTSAIVDASLTKVVPMEGKTMVKVSAWYDNEWSYTAQMLRTAARLFEEQV